jgi:uncharacterized coiled-coil protein SlyX
VAILIQEKERKKVAQTLDERLQSLEERIVALEGGYAFFIQQTRGIHQAFEVVREDLGSRITRLESRVQALEDMVRELPNVLARMIVNELDERDVKLRNESGIRFDSIDKQFDSIDVRFEEVLDLLKRP